MIDRGLNLTCIAFALRIGVAVKTVKTVVLMKHLVPCLSWIALVGGVAVIPLCSLLATETNSSTPQATSPQPVAAPEAQVTPPAAAPKLPYGVEDVLKLSRAQVGDDIVVKYVQNSGTIYTLGPQEIVYLRNQGVSDRVINTMLDQRKAVTEVAAQTTPGASSIPNAAIVPNASMVPPPPDYNQVAPQAAAPPPESSVYVIPSSPTVAYPYYGYYAPYYGYPGYWGPSLTFGFGFGGYGYGHGYYHGGWYGHGGGYHGGYGHGGYGHGGYGHGGYGHGHH